VGPVDLVGPSVAAFRPDTGLAQIVGEPPIDQIVAAAASATEVLATSENVARVRRALPSWSAERAAQHVLPDGWRDVGPPPDCRLLAADDLAAVRIVDPGLAEEIEMALAVGPVTAALRDGAPVSFCYAVSVTEGLWDVSVDTMPSHRRRGFAARAVRFMIDLQARAGRRPVWGSAKSNPASESLARRLGFVPVDTIWVLRPPGSGPEK
jgi:GNAT superfamily N-acetyltransferase